MSLDPCRVCQDSARQSPDGYSDVSHIIFAGLENQKPLTLRYVTFVTLRSLRSLRSLRYVRYVRYVSFVTFVHS